MPFTGNDGDGSGGGGNGRIGALLRQTGETAQGLFISHPEADYDWHLRGVERQLEEAAVPSRIDWENQDQDATVSLLAPVDWIASPERVNTARVSHTRLTAPRDAIAATYDVGDVSVASQQAGTEGNNDLATIVPGAAAHAKRNAQASIDGDRGPATERTHIFVRSPDFGSPQTATAQLLRSGPIYIKVDWNAAGVAGNGFRVRVEREGAVPAGQAAATVDRDGSSNVIGITVGVNGTVSFAAIAAAFNGVSVGGTQLVTAAEIGGQNATRAFIDTSLDDSANLAGGTAQGYRASGTIAGSVVVHYYTVGAVGNGFEVLIDRASTTAGQVNVQYVRKDNGQITASLLPLANLGGIRLVVNGTITRAQIAAALNSVVTDGVQVVTATAGAGSISYTNSNNDEDIELSGGTTGTGAGTNFGEVTVTRAPDSDPPTAATATIDAIDTSGSGGTAPTITLNIAPRGDPAVNIVVTGDDRVGAGKGLSGARIGVLWRASSSIDTSARSGSTPPSISIRLNGTITAQAVVNLLNGYSGSADGEGFSAALASGTTGSTSVTWDSSDTPLPNFAIADGTAPTPLRLTGAGIEVTHPTPGTDGNNATVRVTKGTPAKGLNGIADIVSTQGFAPLKVRSPNLADGSDGTNTNTGEVRVVTGQLHTDPVGATADINIAGPGDTPVVLRVTLTGDSRGTAANSHSIQIGYDPLGGSDPDLSVSGDAPSDGNVEIALRGTVTIASILTALSGNLPLDGGGNSSVHVTSQVIANSGGVTNVTWGSSDAGREVNFAGGVDGAKAATATINVAPSGDTAVNLLFTATTIGAGANGTKISTGGQNASGINIDWDSGQTTATVSMNGTWTLTQLVAAINAASQSGIPAARRFTASIPEGVSGSTSVTWGATDFGPSSSFGSFAGGQAAERDPLSAAWNAANNRLTITARSGDTFGDVRDAIVALDEFNTASSNDNNDPGDVWFGVGAGSNNTVVVDATEGNHIDYDFAGGTDGGIARSTLAADWTSPLLHITGVIPTDTVQDVIDLINALSSAPTAASSGGTVDAANDTIYLPPGSTQSQDYNFTGGAAGGGHTVSAAYTEASNTLAITALPTDTYDAVMDAIAGLSQFQRTRGGNAVNGSMPGDVWRSNNSTTLDIIDTPASVGAAALSYDFENGRDAATRSPLTVVGTVDSQPVAAVEDFLGGQASRFPLTYYKTGTEGNGFVVSYYWRYDPDLEQGRASAPLTLGGKAVRARWHNSDTYGDGVTLEIRRTGSGSNPTGIWTTSPTKRYQVDLPDGTYTLRQIQNFLARVFVNLTASLTNPDFVQGPIRLEVADADLDTEFTVDSTWTTIATAAFAGAGDNTGVVEAEYLSSRELRVTQVVNTTGRFSEAFKPNVMRPAINAARWQGLQLITAGEPESGTGDTAQGFIDVPADAASGLTQTWFDNSDTLSGGTEGASLLTINGIIAADTAQNLHDAYTGPSDLFTFPTGSTAVGTVAAANRASFSGGRDALGRQEAAVLLQDDGDIDFFGILHPDEPQNTTLRELATALWAATYTNTDGQTVPVPFANVVIDVTGGGATSDPMRYQGRPTQGSGGSDFVPEGDIEALVRPHDEADDPNIEVRYHQDHDTLEQILAALLAQGEVDVVDIYGTNLAMVPETPPFIRDMWPEGGDTTFNISGGANLEFLSEGASLGIGTKLNVTGSGATLTGTGLVKTLNFRGGSSMAQVQGQIDADVKPSARVGGPAWPENDIDAAIARDSEVPGLLKDALTEATPSLSFNDEIPFLTASGDWRKADSEAWRQRLSVDVGPWEDTPGGFIFRARDYTTSHGQLFRLLRDSTKNLSSGPETNDDFELIGVFAGDWTDRFFKAGSISRHDGSIWQADVDIAQGAGEPGDNGQWSRLSQDPATVVRVAPTSGTPLAFTCTRADGDTYDVAVDGAADSIVSVELTATTLTVHKRDGSSVVHTFSAGGGNGTTVVANPAGSGGDLLTRLAVGGTDYTVPQPNSDLFFIWWEESSSPSAGGSLNGRQWALGNGATGGLFQIPFDCEVASFSFVDALEPTGALTTSSIQDVTIGMETVDLDATVDYDTTDQTMRELGGTLIENLEVSMAAADDKWGYFAEFVPEADSPISISAGSLIRPVTIQADGGTNPTAGVSRTVTLQLVLRRTGVDEPRMGARPQITSFSLAAGDQSPPAGDISGDTYAFTYAIAQGSHAGSARVIGFKGDVKPTDSVEVLATLSDLNHGGGTVNIPADTTLADGEKFRLRLEVFDEGVTNPSASTASASYQDIVITAHAASAALYHGGRVVYDANDADEAATLARIADFTGDTQTSNVLPSRLTINVPDDGNDYQMYFMAQEDAPQPAGFTSSGLPATASFYDAQEGTYSTVTYNVWILRPGQRVDADDNDDFFGITSS